MRLSTGFLDKNECLIRTGDKVKITGRGEYKAGFEIGMFVLLCEKGEIADKFPYAWNDHIYPLGQLYFFNDDENDIISNAEVV